MADVGQEEDFEAAKEKALKIGAEKCYVEDLRAEFISELCFPAIQANAVSYTHITFEEAHSPAEQCFRSTRTSTSLEPLSPVQ
jgi:argininosuccinate synthase